MNEITNFRGDVIKTQASDGAEVEVSAFVAQVGERVRNARERKGLSRRVLSERSRVSQRYLAQLEAGCGNISIALLYSIARALDHRVEWLIGEEDPWESETVQLVEFFRSATLDQRQKIMAILNPVSPDDTRLQRLCLIGLRGAGKSTLGTMVSRRLDLPFVELNGDIEEQSGMPVDEVMALYGQEGYRRLERQALERVVARSQALVLAVAGGIVAEPETYNYLLRHFHTIWLRANPQDHMSRVRAQGDNRPMAGNPGAMEELKSILTSREKLYARAGAMIETSGKTPEESCADVLQITGTLFA